MDRHELLRVRRHIAVQEMSIKMDEWFLLEFHDRCSPNSVKMMRQEIDRMKATATTARKYEKVLEWAEEQRTRYPSLETERLIYDRVIQTYKELYEVTEAPMPREVKR